ncbi:leucine Rich repeat-containing domain protein [Opisthorchis viverrini]|uniref:Leucine Rich repeat-containing domain protein n=1 Tax=Opisthorchis viverrini TaxID=6198 RepID=A0A1S8WSI8_OPIVI|nr:leucine Rich repeat-containing domain protein [Opisthorchis viverrini]
MIHRIDSCFLNLVNLTDVRLDTNKIEHISSETFAHCKSLTDLDLSYNLLESIELLDADVSDNLITDHALGLEGYPVIQRLNLANNQISQMDDLDPIR